MSFLTVRQYKFLTLPLAMDRVGKDPKGHDHLEAWDVRRWLIRTFGFGGWSFERVDSGLVEAFEIPPEKPTDRPRYTVIWRYEGRLTVKGADGTVAVYEDVAIGDAQNQPNLADAHDQAVKSAASGALKRCAVNLGDQFGLCLYADKAQVVKWSLVRPEPEPGDTENRDDTAEPDEPGVDVATA